MADERFYASRQLRQLTAGLVCPAGCVDRCGRPSAFTWMHVQVYCRCNSVVGLRRAWLQHLSAVTNVVEGGGACPNVDWYRLKRLAAGGLPDALDANREGEIVEGSTSELALRRLVGGLIPDPGRAPGKADRARLVLAVEAGLALQTEGCKMTESVVKEAAALSRALRAMRPAWRAWQQGIFAGGPLRWQAIDSVRGAAEVVREAQRARGWTELVRFGVQPTLHLSVAQMASQRAAVALLGSWRSAHAEPFLNMRQAASQWRVAAALWRWRRWRAERVHASFEVARGAVIDAAWARGLDDAGVADAFARAASIVGWADDAPAVREHVPSAAVQALLALEGGPAVSVAAPVRLAREGRGALAARERMAWRMLAMCDTRAVAAASRDDVRAGRAASRGGLWIVERVMDVRIPTRRRGQQLDVRVCWAGQWGSQQMQWVPVSRLNAAARQAARQLEVRLRRKRMPADDARGEDVQRRRRSPRVEGLPAGGGLERVTRKRQREDAPPAGREPDDDRGVAAMETEGETPVAAMEVDVAEAAV